MVDATRQLLDELMGKDRDSVGDKTSKLKWDDERVCKYDLVAFCPHQLFINTKSDLGTCEKEHDTALKREFQKQKESVRYSYETRFIRKLDELVDDIDRKIKRGQERLDTPSQQLTPQQEEAATKTESEIKTLTQQMQALGEEGKVEESQSLMKMVEELQKKLREIKNSAVSTGKDLEKRMRVCEICGALLVINDAEQRVQAHLNGKQHLGYARIRQTLAELKEKRQKEKESKKEDDKPDKEKDEEKKDRHSERHSSSSHSSSRRRSRSRDHHRHDYDDHDDRRHRRSSRDSDRHHHHHHHSSRDRSRSRSRS
eukprot:TRINITY_DN2311_c0_g2_i1.p1 TRINITY_DN2311_c0_g2~~TRINITY_DN2311_c0_g2_i1.p1  ORF type:complete len:313 (-),score=77.92 TRINITY_DN2311_c0_g2_i1:203-1141(-)